MEAREFAQAQLALFAGRRGGARATVSARFAFYPPSAEDEERILALPTYTVSLELMQDEFGLFYFIPDLSTPDDPNTPLFG